jgi:hypothetical protein
MARRFLIENHAKTQKAPRQSRDGGMNWVCRARERGHGSAITEGPLTGCREGILS